MNANKREFLVQTRTPGFWLLIAGIQLWFGWVFMTQLEPFQLGQIQAANSDVLGISDTLIAPFLRVCQQSLIFLLPPLGASLIIRDINIGLWKQLQVGQFRPWTWLHSKIVIVFLISLLMCILALTTISWLGIFSALDWGKISSGLIGLFFTAMVALMSGLMFASWLRQSFAASVLSIVFLQLLWIIALAVTLRGADTSIMSSLSLSAHLDGLISGMPATTDFIYFSLLILWLYGMSIAGLFWHRGER